MMFADEKLQQPYIAIASFLAASDNLCKDNCMEILQTSIKISCTPKEIYMSSGI